MKIPTILRKNRKVQAGLMVAIVAVLFVVSANNGWIERSRSTYKYKVTVTGPNPNLEGHVLGIIVYEEGIVLESIDITSGVGYLKNDYGNSFNIRTTLDSSVGDCDYTVIVGEQLFIQYDIHGIFIQIDASSSPD